METLLLTNATTHFRSRCVKTCMMRGLSKSEAIRSVNAAFLGKYDAVPADTAEWLKKVIPEDAKKQNIYYDMKSRPSLYVLATFELALLTKGSPVKGMVFCPLRTSSIPSHIKLDTEAVAQCFLPYKAAMEARKSAPDREIYNDYVWNPLLDRKKVDGKTRKFKFHHEITTDGVAASLLFSRDVSSQQLSFCKHQSSIVHEETANCYGGRCVGLDPGKRNIATLVDENGVSMRYTSKQRICESGLSRYKEVLLKERKAEGVEELETELSLHTHKTADEKDFLAYLVAKQKCDKKTSQFYNTAKWRRWKFRLFCRRKQSEDIFLNRIKQYYGSNCTIYYGDWSRKDQLQGCAPSPTVGLRKCVSRKFRVISVDEYRTSKTCNRCMGELSRYKVKRCALSKPWVIASDLDPWNQPIKLLDQT